MKKIIIHILMLILSVTIFIGVIFIFTNINSNLRNLLAFISIILFIYNLLRLCMLNEKINKLICNILESII